MERLYNCFRLLQRRGRIVQQQSKTNAQLSLRRILALRSHSLRERHVSDIHPMDYCGNLGALEGKTAQPSPPPTPSPNSPLPPPQSNPTQYTTKKESSRKVYLRYLLFNGSQTYWDLFSSQHTWLLFVVQAFFFVMQTILILLFSINDNIMTRRGFGEMLRLAGFMSVNTRHAGFSPLENLSDLEAGTLLVFMLMMFLAPSPVSITLKSSRDAVQRREESLFDRPNMASPDEEANRGWEAGDIDIARQESRDVAHHVGGRRLSALFASNSPGEQQPGAQAGSAALATATDRSISHAHSNDRDRTHSEGVDGGTNGLRTSLLPRSSRVSNMGLVQRKSLTIDDRDVDTRLMLLTKVTKRRGAASDSWSPFQHSNICVSSSRRCDPPHFSISIRTAEKR